MKDRILKLMKQLGMSQKQFASELCIGEATLSSIFTGRTKPTNNIVNNIHERFPEVSIPWLMFGEGDMYAGEVVSEGRVSSSFSPQEDMSAQEAPLSSEVSDAVLGGLNMPIVRETIKYIDKPQRKITEIRVFFDDGTYETFSS